MANSQEAGKNIKKQNITFTTIISKIIEAFVGFVLVSILEPLWRKLIRWWSNDNGKCKSDKCKPECRENDSLLCEGVESSEPKQ